MTRLSSSVKLRHVVFADAARHARQPVDFTPRHLALTSEVEGGGGRCCHAEESFLRWLFLRAGLDVRMYRMETLSRRLSACLRVLRCSDAYQARQLLARDPTLISAAISTLVIGVTSFFRDAGVFQHLDDEVLGDLCGRSRWRGRQGLRIWSVGCSDGQELYSVAMLLAERRVLHACHLLGTDCRSDAVERMKLGIYDSAAVRSLSPERLHGFFAPRPLGWQVISGVRSAVHGRVCNALAAPPPPPVHGDHQPWDLILCRNMAMYLKTDAAAALWRELARSLRVGGVLMLGKAERPAGIRGLSYIGPCLYRREPSLG
jgi:chemotaxis methyl-accepting protein methylase